MTITKQSVEAGFGANFKIPDDGKILDLQAAIGMGFFFGNANAWYLNLGTEAKPGLLNLSDKALVI